MNDDLSPARDAELDEAARTLLERLPTPSAGAEARVARRLARSLEAERRPARRVWPLALGGGAMALAAAALALFALLPPAEPTGGAGALASEQAWAAREFEGVSLSYRGVGDVEGEARAPRIEWTRGVLNVEVTPNQGLDVRVSTREAEIRVVGTGFTVTRDVYGTRVEVRHGIVETRCTDGVVERLEQGEALVCAPQSAAGLLGRAQALRADGASPAQVLQSVDAGLTLAAPGPIADELAALRVRALADAGRPTEALVAAEAALAAGGTRREELLQVVGELARPLGGCASAAPWMATLGPDADAACR